MKNDVRFRRDEHGLSQGQLAKELGVSRQTINSIETGKYVPSLPLALALARFFDCDGGGDVRCRSLGREWFVPLVAYVLGAAMFRGAVDRRQRARRAVRRSGSWRRSGRSSSSAAAARPCATARRRRATSASGRWTSSRPRSAGMAVISVIIGAFVVERRHAATTDTPYARPGRDRRASRTSSRSSCCGSGRDVAGASTRRLAPARTSAALRLAAKVVNGLTRRLARVGTSPWSDHRERRPEDGRLVSGTSTVV